MPETLRFCADVHLRKLAHLLKMLGYDTVYKNDFTKEDLHQIARNENRALISKASYFKRFSDFRFYRVKISNPMDQCKEVIAYFDLENFNPFSRCLYCNEILEKTEKEKLEDQLLPKTKKRIF